MFDQLQLPNYRMRLLLGECCVDRFGERKTILSRGVNSAVTGGPV
jgi:hypothetical protein